MSASLVLGACGPHYTYAKANYEMCSAVPLATLNGLAVRYHVGAAFSYGQSLQGPNDCTWPAVGASDGQIEVTLAANAPPSGPAPVSSVSTVRLSDGGYLFIDSGHVDQYQYAKPTLGPNVTVVVSAQLPSTARAREEAFVAAIVSTLPTTSSGKAESQTVE